MTSMRIYHPRAETLFFLLDAAEKKLIPPVLARAVSAVERCVEKRAAETHRKHSLVLARRHDKIFRILCTGQIKNQKQLCDWILLDARMGDILALKSFFAGLENYIVTHGPGDEAFDQVESWMRGGTNCLTATRLALMYAASNFDWNRRS